LSYNLITSASFEKYTRLVNDLFANACDLTVFNADGIAVLTSSAMAPSEPVEGGEYSIKQLLGKAASSQEVQVNKINEAKTLFSQAMTTERDELLGVLVLDVDHDSLPDETHGFGEFDRLVNNISTCIKNECAMAQELNVMANELGERYEELNLVYDTDNYVQDSGEVNTSLRKITKNCVAYLDVGAAHLNLPREKISISHNNSFRAASDAKVIVESTTNHLFNLVKESKSSIVFNELHEMQEMLPGTECKILSSPVVGGDGEVIGCLVIIKNIQEPDYTNSDRNLLEVMSKKVTQVIQANYDTLTSLLNRAAYKHRIDKTLPSARDTGAVHVVLDIDLDDLQVINDTYSFQAGDTVLKRTAKIIQEQLRDTDIVSRIGGDEFGALLENCPLEFGIQIADKILQAINDLKIIWDNTPLEISATIGVAVIDEETENSTNIISEAELAMAAAKDLGKNRAHVFQRGGEELVTRKEQMQWVPRIKAALRENRFVLYAQPIRALDENAESHHIEILLRLQDEKGNILAPWAFMPAAERYHLMPEIDRWVVNQTLTMISGHANKQLGVAINLSGQSLGNEKFLAFVLEKLSKADYPLQKICFEITESAAISNLVEAKKFMSVLKAKGCQFSLDDFGTGLSSFSYLKELPVNFLKIDGSFVKEILEDSTSEAMVSAIHQVGKVMGLETIAEFVENDAIKDKLNELGINYVQGYGIGMPQPLFEELKTVPK